jgi:CheY-like chemotaxis protein
MNILLVEDNELNADLTSRRLERRGHRVTVAPDGQRALELANLSPPDLILMDMSIPVIDGWTVTRSLRAGESTRRIPIIAVTAHAMAGDRQRAIDAGCDDYHTKPGDFAELLAKIDALGKRPVHP